VDEPTAIDDSLVWYTELEKHFCTDGMQMSRISYNAVAWETENCNMDV